MKTVIYILIASLAVSRLAADPTMREKITTAIADSDQRSLPPPLTKQTAKPETPPPAPTATPAPEVAATVQLPDFQVTAPLIKNKQQVELLLAKNQIAARQEEKQLKSTEADKVLNNEAYQFGMLAFGSATASARAANARYRLSVMELDQTVLLSTLATGEEDKKELMQLLAKTKGPTPY